MNPNSSGTTSPCYCTPRKSSTCLYGLVLAATASPVDVAADVRRIEDGCGVACIGNKIPAARSVFQLVPATRQSQPNSRISYGSVFFVQLVHASDALYLRSEPPLVDGRFAPRYHNPVRLNRLRDCYAKWRAVHWDRHQRFETEGEPVSPCERIVIQHVMTNQCLAVEHRDWHCSLLGFESGVSVHTYSDLYHNETSECIWNILAEPMDDDHHSAHCRIKSSSSSSSSS
ncbi:cilia- and flagella-associated protein 161 [Copidosoma floridanum]|uniref:cilia- and flagella-associated protein 161 n=1 Tax=Copidosoma floridanum TaxID=29053 RepID=UPI0006C9461C|nr:cilia- and flagella-associated protein 161 [Copidosoma floridanum]